MLGAAALIAVAGAAGSTTTKPSAASSVLASPFGIVNLVVSPGVAYGRADADADKATPTPSPKPRVITTSPTTHPTTKKPTPTPTRKTVSLCGAPSNPWGFNFCGRGHAIRPTALPAGVCSYFDCIASFYDGRGYMVECNDDTYSMSGGIQGACSHHRGERREVYSG